MSRKIAINIPRTKIAEFCRKYHICKLSLFGSVLRSDFRVDSDIDVLVEFEHGHSTGFFGLARMERELSDIFDGKKVDIRTPYELSRYFKNDVISQAVVQYAEG